MFSNLNFLAVVGHVFDDVYHAKSHTAHTPRMPHATVWQAADRHVLIANCLHLAT